MMRSSWMRRPLLAAVCIIAAILCSFGMVFADDTDITMVEGDVKGGFDVEETTYESEDPSIAWIDELGSLNAMNEGTTVITAKSGDETVGMYNVTVEDYTDGTEVVGRLKILARYNDSMQFYDGHSYLLFTSYQDGVDLTVQDLYGGYNITRQYYKDISEDISNGSNHTGNDAEKYFEFDDDMTTVRVDRGEIVTIGMYRGFDLTVPQAALGMLENSTMWKKLSKEGKTAAVKAVFSLLTKGKITEDEAIAGLIAIFKEAGVDYEGWLDGVVEGGVCFNRELYNQKLEWDQFENVTYEIDITRKQLNMLVLYLNGNLDKFNIAKNSCATVALRAWNAAIGTRNGEKTSYWLSCKGEGVYSFVDAPKGVRDAIRNRLPGYYLNNSKGVAEPDAGFQDETGWVYVSAPEPVDPVVYAYSADTDIVVDRDMTKMADLINAAKAGTDISYSKDYQRIDVDIDSSSDGDVRTISGIGFTINGETVKLGPDNVPESGIWFSVQVQDPQEGEEYYVIDADDNVLPSEYDDGWVAFYTDKLPVSFKIIGSSEGTHNILRTKVARDEGSTADAEVYYYDGEKKKVIGEQEEVKSGTKIYIKPLFETSDFESVLTGIMLNSKKIGEEDFDADEEAYVTVMPVKYSALRITFRNAAAERKQPDPAQVSVGDTLKIEDYIGILDSEQEQVDELKWFVLDDEESVLELDDSNRILTVKKPGKAFVWAAAASNSNVGEIYSIEAYESTADMVRVTFDESDDFSIIRAVGGDDDEYIPYSGYLVEKGTELAVKPTQTESKAVAGVFANDELVKANDFITMNEDTEIKVSFADAYVTGVPETIKLEVEGDSYKINGAVKYKGAAAVLPVYDQSIRYVSADPLVEVDQNGVVTVVGEVPESGRKVIITAYAGSSNDTVYKDCSVIVGDYKGTKIVGKATIHSRVSTKDEPFPHSSFTFQTYDDLDLNISYYMYYKPEQKYTDLMWDYEDHPEKYDADPAIYNDNDPELVDRKSYFKEMEGEAFAEPQKVSLKTGESISISAYDFGPSNLQTILCALEKGDIALTEYGQELIEQLHLYIDDEEIDGEKAFDSLVETLVKAYMMTSMTGYNPINGISEGGTILNREMFNQFRRNDTQFPNNYYQIEITGDELAALQRYLAEPSNNFYSLFTRNCTTAAVDAWNAALEDKPELNVKGNYTGFAADCESLYAELGLMRAKKDLPGRGGVNFYPRCVPSRHKWGVTAEDNNLISRCVNNKSEHYYGTCKLAGPAISFTATGCNYSDVVIENLDEFNEVTGLNAAADEQHVKFYAAEEEGVTEGGKEVAVGTSDPGYYYAALTVAGKSAKYAFTIGKPAVDYDKMINKGYKVKRAGAKVKVTWGKVPVAARYKVYAKYAGKGKMKVVKTVKATKKATTFSKLNGKKLNLKKAMNVKVIAYDKSGRKVAKTRIAKVKARKK